MNYSKVEAAYIILEEYKRPLHLKEIIRISLEREMIQTDGKTPHSTLGADMLKENSRRESQNREKRFKRTAPATWGLTKWYK